MKEDELKYIATATNLPQAGNFKDLSNAKVCFIIGRFAWPTID